MTQQPYRRQPAPFKEGDWVLTLDDAHPMRSKRGKVVSVEYTGQGATNQYLVIVVFDNVHPRHKNRWTFRHQDLKVAPASQVAEPYRTDL